jgi:hypothetical protein
MTSIATGPEQLASGQAVSCSPEVFRENLNVRPFEVAHHIADNPLFDVQKIAEVAQNIANRKTPNRKFGDATCLIGQPEAGQKTLEGSKFAPIEETIRNIEHSDGWIMLNHIEREPGYREVLESCICDLLQLSGRDMLKQIKWFDAIIFVTSPNRVTPYHIDRECAWLLQLRGNKEIHLFERADKEVTPDEELERYWSQDNSAGVYKPDLESHAKVFPLHPGNGVHIPVNTPHWLKNGNNVSVSMNVNFVFHDHLWGNIYRANYYLRQRGLKPSPPGVNPVADKVKSLAITTAQKIGRRVKGSQYIPDVSRDQYDRIAQIMASRQPN